jgi:hypothetical protein
VAPQGEGKLKKFLDDCAELARLEIRDRKLEREFVDVWFHSLLLLLVLVLVARGLTI